MSITEPVIAVLDDQPEMVKALRRLLTTQGFRLVEYETGEALLAALDAQSLDCVLLELQMPGISGFELMKTLQLRHLSVPVIALTTYDEPGTEERVRSLGACAYLTKPVDRAVLLSAIRAATGGSSDPRNPRPNH